MCVALVAHFAPGRPIVKKIIIKKGIDITRIMCYNDYSKKKKGTHKNETLFI